MTAPAPAQPAGATGRGFARVIAASLAGTTIEFYDFFLYGSAAALVFNKVFFPAGDPVIGVLLALATYAVGFLARPLGGILFGHLGDRFGRRRTLALSLGLMGGSTVLIGLIPSYDTIGVAAPLILTLLRLIQGVALGGEWGGAILLVTEHAPKQRRGFWAAWPQSGGPLGNMLATGVLAVLGLVVTDAQFTSWAWRLAFLVSAVLVLVGLWLRRAVEESPQFLALQQQGNLREGHAPLRIVLRDHKREVTIAALANMGEKTAYYAFSIFLLSYFSEQLHLPKSTGLIAVAVGSVFQVAAMLLGGHLSDRLGRRNVNLTVAVLIAVWGLVGLPLVDGGHLGVITLTVSVGLALHGLMCGSQAAFFAELFPSAVRYTGASLGYQIATVLGGSAAPLLGVALMRQTGATWPVGVFLVCAELCTVAAFLWVGETKDRDPDAVAPSLPAPTPTPTAAH
ncbi:MFS transporter [Streptomyces sp. KR55]|uniref:MFS transporter n=1 Tax=Streptomyces sp. KR55 TaxID=3457425 RepID=UPI003FD18084